MRIGSDSARRRLSVWMLALVSGAALAAPQEPPAADPFLREALFHYFRNDPLAAASRLLTAQQSGRLPPSPEAELLLASALLSAGLHTEAAQRFDALAAAANPRSTQDQAWYFIGKIRYQRDQHAAARAALERIRDRLPDGLENERRLLLAQILLRQAEYRRAAAHLREVTGRSPEALYARFNLGVALIKAGDRAAGVALLDELGRTPVEDEELLSLRDQANVSLGYASLQTGDAGSALQYLERVRLQGMLANKALLGFGWAKWLLDRHDQALVPWQELATRDPSDPAVQEAYLAVAYTYNTLGAPRQALRWYENALEAFRAESARLEQSIGYVRAGTWLKALAAPVHSPETTPNPHLALLEANPAVHEALRSYRRLRRIESALRERRRSLSAWREAITERRQGYRPLATATENRWRESVRHQSGRILRLELELERIERESDVAALASRNERQQMALLEQIQRRLGRRDLGPEAEGVPERLRRLRGALLWNLTAVFPSRLEEARKSMAALRQRIAETERFLTSLLATRHDLPRTYDTLAVRLRDLESRLAELESRTRALADKLKEHVETLAISELERQKDQLTRNIGLAHLMLAQIHESGSGRAGR